MVTLADLNSDQKGLTLEELNVSQPIPPAVNPATASNIAAHAAVLSSPEEVMKNYSAINMDLSSGQDSFVLENLLKQTQSLDKEASYNELQRILRDPSLSQEEKAQYYDGFIQMSTDRPGSRSLSVLVAQQAITQPQSEDENDETVDTTTFNAIETLDAVDAYRGWVQNAISTQTNLKNRDWFNLSLDFVESIVPFLDQASVAKTRLSQGAGVGDVFKTLTLLGDSKEEVKAAIQRMPIEQRYEVAQKLIDLVKNTGGSFTIRPNELSVVNQLNTFLVDGAYGDGDKLLDNIFSVMDIVLPIGGWVGKLVKGAKGAKEAAIIAERAARAEERIVSRAAVEEVAPATKLPEAGNVLEEPLILKGKTFSETSPLTRPKDIAKPVNLINSNLTTKKAGRSPTEFEIGVQGPQRPVLDELEALDLSKIDRLATRTTVDHTTLSQTMKDANAGKARALNQMMESDQTGQVARATYGTTRTEAIANDRLPEVSNIDGSVRNKVKMDEAGPAPDKETVSAVMQDRGRIDLDAKEKTLMREKVKDEFKEVVGLTPRTEMGTIGDTPTGVSFDMVYGPKDGGFKSAKQALSQVLIGLRKYGVTDKEVEILTKDATSNYVPVKGIPQEDGNYLIRVKHDYEFAPGDVVDYTTLGNSKYAMFESRTSLTDERAGSIREHIIPASAIINKVVFNSASAAADASAKITKRLVKLGEVYAKKYKKLSSRQKTLVDLYRIEANEKGLKFSSVNLKARGFDDDAIETMRSWKTITDTMWALENVDMNKTLRSRGWERFVDQVNDTDLVARPVSVNRVGPNAKVYDPETHTIRTLREGERDELYAKGGTIAETKQPVELLDDTVEHILVQNNETGFLRRIRDDDKTLPYRDGYYPVKYTDPIFITKEFRRKDGTVYHKAVASAGSQTDANRLLERLRTTDKDGVYASRPDYKRGTSNFEDAEWSVAVSSGRSAQRVRGQRLATNETPTDLHHKHIESPEESLIQSIRSLSARTAFRDWLETTKSRWMSQYSDLVEPQNGQVMWPNDPRHIAAKNLEADSKRVKDAKATWKFVRSMEGGYVNLIDDLSKVFFRNMSQEFGEKGWQWLNEGKGIQSKGAQLAEKLADKASQVSPISFARKKAFRLLLAANPLRQLPVQAMQALPVLLATNPLAIPRLPFQIILLDYLANGGDARSFVKAIAKHTTGFDMKDAAELQKHWEASGFEAAVDANSLIRDQLGSLINHTPWDKTKATIGAPLDITQKIGFNAGEKILMRSVWLSEYDLLRKSGKTIDAEALDNLNARVRNLTLNMNRAGEMPYNENALSAAMQFFQAPHKAFSQVLLGHTGLSTTDRIKLGTSYVLTYGIGANWLTNWITSAIPMDGGTKELVEGGLFNLAMNTALSNIYGQEVRTDFSDSLRLLDPELFTFWEGLMTNEVGEVLSSSASMGLVFGQNPRVTNFVKQMMRPFTVENDKKPEELLYAGKAFLEMFSGMSNYFKAKYAMEMEKTITSRGATIDYHVNGMEAFLKAAGFSTIDEIHHYASQEELYKKGNEYREDIKKVVDEISSRLASRGISNEEADWYITMMSEAQRVFNNNPFYMKEFVNQIKYKALAGENSIYTRLRSMAGWMDAGEFERLVNNTNLPDDAKKTLINSKKFFTEIK